MARIGLKIDVDTLRGHTEGVPRLLELLRKLHLRATFFFSLGPDNSGRALVRFFRKGFLEKMRRTGGARTYGMKTLLYGTLLKAPIIGERAPEIIRKTFEEGHEVGLHAWDHVTWQDWLHRFSQKTLENHINRGVEALEAITGTKIRSCAAPGWQISPPALNMQEEKGFSYASDTRGLSPFLPTMGGKDFHVPQLPTTLPTLDEVWGRLDMPPEKINGDYLTAMGRSSYQVHTIHAEMEGLEHLTLFENLVLRCLGEGHVFVPLGEIAQGLDHGSLERKEIVMGPIPGRAGKVAWEGGTPH